MIKAIIVDDEQPAIDIMKVLLAKDGRIDIQGTYRKPKEVISEILNLRPEVVFLDVQMPLMNGVELAQRLIELQDDLEIVFVTAYEHYAVEAFKLNAVDYLMKPLSPEQIKRTVDRLWKKREGQALRNPKGSSRILCFGGLKLISQDEQELPLKWRTNKAEELFAYLCCHKDAAVTKWEIMESLWPDSNDEQAHSHLHTTLYKMKKTLMEAQMNVKITFFRGSYRMEIQGISSDLAEFEQFGQSKLAVTEQNAAEFQRILAFYSGDLFGELDYGWSIELMEKYRASFVALSKRLSSYLLKTEQHQLAEEYIQRMLKAAVLDEEGWLMLLECHYMQKDRVALIRSYEKLVYLLKHELGIEPTESIKLIYEKMLKGI